MASRRYDLDLEYEPRVASLHLGERKYTTPSRAIGELVANAFDAEATRVAVEVVRNQLGGDEGVRVEDDGRGMTLGDIRQRFAKVGVEPPGDDPLNVRFARFGVGRFAAHKLGRTAEWTTTAREEGASSRKFILRLESEQPGKLVVLEDFVANAATGTVVDIWDLRHPDSVGLQPSRIAADLAAQFCAFLIADPRKELIVQGTRLNVHSLIDRQHEELIDVGHETPAILRHLVFTDSLDRSRFPESVVYAAKGQTVGTDKPEFSVAPQYLALVEWAYLEEIVTANREALIELDPSFQRLQTAVLERVAAFQTALRDSHTKLFLKEAREREYYPFHGAPKNALMSAQRVVYDAVLTEVNQHVNVEGMTQRQQAVVFRLLKRALENEDLLEILGELIDVPDSQLSRFREILSRTTLDSIVRLTSEVSGRLDYLDQLHELIYGANKKFVLERAHLHKLLEPYAWLFGEAFHLATSDQTFRSVIARHRAIAGLPAVDETSLQAVNGIDLIPDLFLAADKEYSQNPKHRRLLVEIKAPKIPIGKEQVDQIQRYADVIIESSEFDTASTEWDLFLVSAEVKPEIQRRRVSADRPFGMLDHISNLRIWVFRWSEIISRARDELRLVREHLDRKTTELNLDYWGEKFPEIVEGILERRDRKVKPSHDVAAPVPTRK